MMAVYLIGEVGSFVSCPGQMVLCLIGTASERLVQWASLRSCPTTYEVERRVLGHLRGLASKWGQFNVIPGTDQEGTGSLQSCQGPQRLAAGQFYVIPQDIVKGVLAVSSHTKDCERR